MTDTFQVVRETPGDRAAQREEHQSILDRRFADVQLLDVLRQSDIGREAVFARRRRAEARRRELLAELEPLPKQLQPAIAEAGKEAVAATRAVEAAEQRLREARLVLMSAMQRQYGAEHTLEVGISGRRRELAELADPRIDELRSWILDLDHALRHVVQVWPQTVNVEVPKNEDQSWAAQVAGWFTGGTRIEYRDNLVELRLAHTTLEGLLKKLTAFTYGPCLEDPDELLAALLTIRQIALDTVAGFDLSERLSGPHRAPRLNSLPL